MARVVRSEALHRKTRTRLLEPQHAFTLCRSNYSQDFVMLFSLFPIARNTVAFNLLKASTCLLAALMFLQLAGCATTSPDENKDRVVVVVGA